MKKFLSLLLALTMLLTLCGAASAEAGVFTGAGDSEIGGKGAIEVAVTVDENGAVTGGAAFLAALHAFHIAEILQKRRAPFVFRRDLSAVQDKCCVFHAASPFPRRYLGYFLYKIVCFLRNKLLFVLYTASENCQAPLLTGAEITDKI